MAEFNHGTDMEVGEGFSYESIPATYDFPSENYGDSTSDTYYGNWSDNVYGSVTRCHDGKGVWTFGNSYAFNKGNTLTEINGHTKSTTSGWTENYFFGGKYELTAGLCMAVKLAQDNTITIGATTAFRMAADLVVTCAPKLSLDFTPYNFALTTGQNYKFDCLKAYQIGPEDETAKESIKNNIANKTDCIGSLSAMVSSLTEIIGARSSTASSVSNTSTTVDDLGLSRNSSFSSDSFSSCVSFN